MTTAKAKCPGTANRALEKAGLGKVAKVLESCESEADGSGIDDPVVAFVKGLAVAQQQPEHQQFGAFFGDGRTEEGQPDGFAQAGRSLGVDAGLDDQGVRHDGQEG